MTPEQERDPEAGPDDTSSAATPSDPTSPSPEHLTEEDKALEAEFAALLDQHLPGESGHSRGEVVEVRVVAVREDSVLVDFGGKAEAVIPIEEFPLVGDKRAVEVNQMIPVVQTGRGGGEPRLSHRQARLRAAVGHIREAKEAHRPLEGTVTRVVKGGVMVDVGFDAFMPASQVDLFRVPDLNKLVGEKIDAYVIEFDERRGRAVLSRRQLLFESREKERNDFLSGIHVDSVITGKVKSVMDFGVFVSLGILDGFIPREEISWDRGKSPADLLKAGEEVEVKVISIDGESGKITLSRKRLTENPWDRIDEKFPPGAITQGRVVAIQNYGAFIHLEEGITGMVHASDMSWELGNKKPEDFVHVDQDVTCQVIDIDRKKKRVSLGLKQLTKDPWEEVQARFPPGTVAEGKVTSMTNYGAFVRLSDFAEGMVHVSDLTWNKRVNHPKEILKSGQDVKVVVLKLDSKDRRISLGLKQLEETPFDAFNKAHKVGSAITGKVTRFAPFGAFVEVAPGIEGLIHISEIDTKRVELPENVLTIGEEVLVKIKKVDKEKQKISLSRREALRAAEKEEIRAYTKKNEDAPGGMSLGDAFRAAQERADGE